MLPLRFVYVIKGEHHDEAGIIHKEGSEFKVDAFEFASSYFPVDTELLITIENKDAKILIVEDNKADAELAIKALISNNQNNESNILHLESGEAAMAYLRGKWEYKGRNTSIQPQLVILDLNLLGMSGLDVLRRIKEEDDLKKIKVVIMSGFLDPKDIQLCYELGASMCILKPPTFLQLKEMLALIEIQ